MDSVSAVGMAAAIVQFLDVGVKVLKTCKEVRDDAQSATVDNKELEQAARTLEHYRGELSSVMRSKQTDRRIVSIAHECARTAKEIIDLLEYVRGGNKQIGKAKATWRAMLKRKPIEELQKTMKQREDVLDKLLNQDTNSSVQGLREELRKQGASSRDSIDRLSSRMVSLSLSNNKRIAVAERNLHRRFDRVDKQTHQARDEMLHTQDRERFLASLFFSEMDQRRSTIKDAYPDTFEWIWPRSDGASHGDFAAWLQSDDSVYWVSGKAGSGKSTLMAYVLEHERTQEGLQVWSQGSPLVLLSFFFWRPGTELQKSVLGLLRSLLYQICRAMPTAVKIILARLQSAPSLLPTWTERTLMIAARAAISAAGDHRLCIFIDGLDEFTGQYDDLVDLVFDL